MDGHETLRILCVCDDDAIRFSREPLLIEAGYGLTWLPSNADLNAVAIRRFDVAIICQSVSWRRAAHLTAVFRRVNPGIRILRINTLRSEMDNSFEIDCELVSGMGALIQILDSIGNKQRESYALGTQHRWAFNPS